MLCKVLALAARCMKRTPSKRYNSVQTAIQVQQDHAAQGFGTQNTCIGRFGMNFLRVRNLALDQGIYHNEQCNQKLSWNSDDFIVTQNVSDLLSLHHFIQQTEEPQLRRLPKRRPM